MVHTFENELHVVATSLSFSPLNNPHLYNAVLRKRAYAIVAENYRLAWGKDTRE